MIPYYDDGTCVIYHGDCLEVLENLDGDWSVVTDPPYGVGYKYDVHDDTPTDYWPRFRGTVDTLRAIATPVVFTHRVKALAELTGWDWVAVWNKPLAMAGLNWLPIMPHWEPIFLYDIGGRDDLPRSFDVISVNPVNARSSDHPCPKPVELYRELIRCFTPPSRTILDPFMGSGTTLRAAKDLGRKAVGIELSERYCEIAANRLAQEVLPL